MTQHLFNRPITPLQPPPRRYLGLCLPWLPAERAIRARLERDAKKWSPVFRLKSRENKAPPDAPFALVAQERGALRIAALDPGAAELGLERGLGLAEARARVPQLATLAFTPDQDSALIEKLARLCGNYTPSVAIDPPSPLRHGLVLDITGCAHLHGGEQALAQAVVRRFAKLGITARPALGDTPAAARALSRFGAADAALARFGAADAALARFGAADAALARFGAADAIPPDSERARVTALPLAALSIDGEALTALRRAGFRRIGDLAELPRAPLAARFGSELVRQLGYLLGEADPHIAVRRQEEPIALSQRFAEPIARTDDVLDTIETLLGQAAAQLAQRRAGGRAFATRLHRSDGHVARLAVATSAATRDPALVMRLLRERIDSLADPLDPGFGYDAIDLDVVRSEPLAETQQSLDQDAGDPKTPDIERDAKKWAPVFRIKSRENKESRALCDPFLSHNALAPLLDRLAVRYGAGSILRFAGADSHIPERAGTLRPVTTDQPMLPALPFPPIAAGEPPRRPLLLFDPPQRLQVIAAVSAPVSDAPPRRFAWRGRSYVAVRHEGPERIAPEWWRRRGGHANNPGLTRDYYHIEDERGQRFWVFRHGLSAEETSTPCWYVHGLFA